MDKFPFPAGTGLSFKGNSTCYELTYPEIIKKCPPNCQYDHDCYEEDYIAVTEKIGTAFPISQLNYIFDPMTSLGTKFVM